MKPTKYAAANHSSRTKAQLRTHQQRKLDKAPLMSTRAKKVAATA